MALSERVDALLCPFCDSLVESGPFTTAYRCGRCDEVYESREDAEECCPDVKDKE